MSQRRSRGSITLPWSGLGETEERSQAELFDDFRKRHSKQNRDIIVDNATRMAMIKSLRDEVQSLQNELFEVRRANAVLKGKMRRMGKEMYNRSESTRVAIEQVLSIVPALQTMYTVLSAGRDPATLERDRLDLANYPMMGVTNATNPAANGAAAHRLGVLTETSEYGSDSGLPAIEPRKSRRVSRGRRTGIGSVATRSPLPSRPASKSRQSESPLRPASPIAPLSSSTAVRVLASDIEKKAKKRRESGLLQPFNVETTAEFLERITSDEMSSQIGPTAPEPLKSVERNVGPDVDTRIGKRGEMDGVARGQVSSTDNMNAKAAVSTNTNAPNGMEFELFSPLSVATNLDDDGGRGRRSRKSVNYKEPSLVKKMRKPDGYNEHEGLFGRQSMSSSHANSAAHQSSSTGTPSASSPTSQASRPSRPPPAVHMAGTRRKSVLPKSGARPPPSIPDNDDDDEVEEALGMSLGLDMGEARTSTPLPHVQLVQQPQSGFDPEPKSEPSIPIRTSPRKARATVPETSIRPSGPSTTSSGQTRTAPKPQLGVGRPTASSTARGAPASHRSLSGASKTQMQMQTQTQTQTQGRARDALAEMPALNGRLGGPDKADNVGTGKDVKGANGMGFEANVKKATRRISSAV